MRYHGPHTVLPIAISCLVIFSWISSKVWNLFPFKGDCSLGKSQKLQAAKSGLEWGCVAESPGWFDVSPKNCTRCDAEQVDVVMKLPVTSGPQLQLLNHLTSFHGGMFKLNTKFGIDSLLYSLSHFECDGHTGHMRTEGRLPPPLTSTVKSSLFTHVHSSPLSLAARVTSMSTNRSHCINNG